METPLSDTEDQQVAPAFSLPIKEAAALLVKHFDLHEGLFDLAFEVQVAIGQFGVATESMLPGAAMMIRGVGLQPAQTVTAGTVDAADVNPAS
jgi:hypothetical protein